MLLSLNGLDFEKLFWDYQRLLNLKKDSKAAVKNIESCQFKIVFFVCPFCDWVVIYASQVIVEFSIKLINLSQWLKPSSFLVFSKSISPAQFAKFIELSLSRRDSFFALLDIL